MSIHSGMKSSFATLKGIEANLLSLLPTSQNSEEVKGIHTALQLIDEVKKDMHAHIITTSKDK